MKKVSVFLVFLVGVLLLAACSKLEPHLVLLESYGKTAKLEGSSFDVSFKVNVDGDIEDPSQAQIIDMVNNSDLRVYGAYSTPDKRAEVVLNLQVKGDMSFGVELPIIINDKDIYIKIPNTPFFPIPEEYVGKYLKVSADDLPDETLKSDTDLFGNQEEVTKLFQEIAKVVLSDLKSTSVLSMLEKEDIPSGMTGVEKVVQAKLTDGNLDEFATVLTETTLPKLVELLTKEENLKTLNTFSEEPVTSEEIRELTSKENIATFREGIEEIRSDVTLEEVSAKLGVGKSGYIEKQHVTVSVTLKDEADFSGTVTVEVKGSSSDFNKPQFKYDVPSESNTISLEDMGMSF